MPIMLKGASKDYLALLIGTVLMAAGHWLLLAHWSHISGPEGTGNYSLALAVCAPLFMLGTLGLRVQLATDQSGSLDIQPLLYIRLATTAVASAAAGLILITMGVGWVALAVISLKAIEALADLAHGAMQRSSQIYRQGLSLSLKALLGIACFYLAWQLTGSSLASMASATAIWTLVFARHDARWLAWKPPSIAQISKAFKPVYRNGLPLVLAASVSGVAVNGPRYALDAVLGREAQGAFASLSSFVVLANMVVTVACQVALPHLTRLHLERNNKAFFGLSAAMMLIVAFTVLAGFAISVIWSDALVSAAFGSDMKQYSDKLPWVVLASSPWLLGQALSYSAMATRRFKAQLVASTASLIIVSLSITTLISSFGIIGAAMGLGIIGITQSLFSAAIAIGATKVVPNKSTRPR